MTRTTENRFAKHSRKMLLAFYLFLGISIVALSALLVKAVRDEFKRGGERYIVLREPRPFQDHSEAPGPEVLKLAVGLENKLYRIRVDSDGYIMPSRIHQSPDVSIVFLGGSTTECQFMDEKSRFPYLAGRMLEKTTGLRINAFNSARSGNNTLHSLFILQSKVIPLRPKAVVMMECINDLTMLSVIGSYYYPSYSRGIVVNKEYNPLRNFLLSFQRKDAEISYDATDEFANHRGKGNGLVIKDICAAFKKNLELFVYICKQNGIVPILMTQFNRFDSYTVASLRESGMLEVLEKRWGSTYDGYVYNYNLLNDVTRVVATEQHVLLIDLDRLVPKTDDYLYDMVHLSEKGSIFVADVIANELVPVLTR